MENSIEHTTNFDFSPAKLDQIYLQLSESTGDYQKLNTEESLLAIINETFNEKLRQIDNKKLIGDENLLNGSFCKFYLECKNNKISDISKIFLFYCDFFDLEYNPVYLKLHVKLRNLIEDMFIYKIGGYVVYDKLKEKYGVAKHKTLFDLVK